MIKEMVSEMKRADIKDSLDAFSVQFEIGTVYTNRRGQKCTVVDVLKTFNSAGKFVNVRYVAEHQLMGQSVSDSDVLEITIAKSLWERGI